jgi:hypothetical protein
LGDKGLRPDAKPDDAEQIMNPIDRVLSSGLTAAQLIEALSEMDSEAVPLFVCDHGDYWHTQQALPITEVRGLDEAEVIQESAYSKSGISLEEISDDETFTAAAEKGGRPNVVILR